jgi:hypothetical protein
MVSDLAWKRGVKEFLKVSKQKYELKSEQGLRFSGKDPSYLCKSCFELANPNPKYMSFDAYMNRFHPSTKHFHVPDEYREAMRQVWDMDPEFTKEEHNDELRYLFEPTDEEFNAGRAIRAFRRGLNHARNG